MKLVLYDDYKPGLLKGDAIVDIGEATREVAGRNGQETMQGIITHFDSLRGELGQQLSRGAELPLSGVQLRAPLPKPSKIVCMGANFREFLADRPGLPILVFLKSPEAILGQDGTVMLPQHEFPICHHEAEMVVVVGAQAKNVSEDDAMDCVFGYTNGVDVSCRGGWNGNFFIGKSFDTFAPLGPCIVTKDEIPDPHKLQVRFWVDGQPRHDYNMSDVAHPIPECVAYCSSIMTLNPGDPIFMGTNHQGIGPLQDGETEMEIEGVGRLRFKVSDPLKRSWPKQIDKSMAEFVRNAVDRGKLEI